MGRGRWSRWGRGSCEGHSLEFGFSLRFDIRPGRRTDGVNPDFWLATSRAGPLGEFQTFEAAAQACEDQARRHIEPILAHNDSDPDLILMIDHWKMYLALPHRLRSRKTSSRRR